MFNCFAPSWNSSAFVATGVRLRLQLRLRRKIDVTLASSGEPWCLDGCKVACDLRTTDVRTTGYGAVRPILLASPSVLPKPRFAPARGYRARQLQAAGATCTSGAGASANITWHCRTCSMHRSLHQEPCEDHPPLHCHPTFQPPHKLSSRASLWCLLSKPPMPLFMVMLGRTVGLVGCQTPEPRQATPVQTLHAVRASTRSGHCQKSAPRPPRRIR